MCGRFYVPEKDLDDFAGLVNKIEKELLKKQVRCTLVTMCL